MCGIIGIIGKAPVTPLLLEALKRLEYRGYDSAGVATLVNGHIDRRRAEGKLVNLEALAAQQPLPGTIGIGHTRWATHGKPSERNAHPIATDRVAVVHNGIIENFQELKDELVADGCTFDSDTDTEAVAQLLTRYLNEQLSPEEAMQRAMGRLRGAFSLVALVAGRHDILMAARRGSSLAIGHGEGAMYIGTDALALAPFTSKVRYLEDNDWAVLTTDGCTVTSGGKRVERPLKDSGFTGVMVGKGNHQHFMLKEIHEQPTVAGDTLQHYLNPARAIFLPELPFEWSAISGINLTACGTAKYACDVAAYWFGLLANLPAHASVASEFRYGDPPLPAGGAVIAVSQSGETIDTLEALRYAESKGQTLLSVVNVPESAITRFAHVVLPTAAGPEIGVASTKGFTTQLIVLLSAAIAAGVARGVLGPKEAQSATAALIGLPAQFAEVLETADAFRALGVRLEEEKIRDVLYLGRGPMATIAYEGALKLKELAYIHAEGYPAGEMKHGPIALIDSAMYSVFLAPTDRWFDKTASNFEQVHARGGKIILLSDAEGIGRIGAKATHCVTLPTVDPLVTPMIYGVAVQLLAYYTALAKGTDIDQPRNLAKSVTVE